MTEFPSTATPKERENDRIYPFGNKRVTKCCWLNFALEEIYRDAREDIEKDWVIEDDYYHDPETDQLVLFKFNKEREDSDEDEDKKGKAPSQRQRQNDDSESESGSRSGSSGTNDKSQISSDGPVIKNN